MFEVFAGVKLAAKESSCLVDQSKPTNLAGTLSLMLEFVWRTAGAARRHSLRHISCLRWFLSSSRGDGHPLYIGLSGR